MQKNRIAAIALVFIVICFVTGCNSKYSRETLNDLGGVFSYGFDDLDFKVEISGTLSEGNSNIIRDKSESSEIIRERATSGELTDESPSSIKRAWGISRRPNNITPGADPGTPELLKKYGGLYIGDTNKKVIYLTFDEGYENGYTSKILDTLRDNNVKAVFFITGPYLKTHIDLVRRMVEEGHIVGNHTVSHPSLPSLSEKELEEEVLGLDRAFKEKFEVNMKYLRPPKGEYSEKSLEITQRLGYTNMFWSFAYDDWYRDKIRGAEYTYNIVMRNLHNGEIMLLHAVSKDNADALDMIIKGARSQGYEFGDVADIN